MPNLQRTLWDRMKPYFNINEAWGSPWKISGLIMFPLYEIRRQAEVPFIIHCGTQGKHARHSYHYKGLAVDFHLGQPKGWKLDEDIFEQALVLTDIMKDLQILGFMGFGIYPFWKTPGFHLDARGYKSLWIRDANGEYHYYTDINKLVEEWKHDS